MVPDVQRLTDSLRARYFPGLPAVYAVICDDSEFEKSNCQAFYNGSIILRPSYALFASETDLLNTLKHELIHAWNYWKNLREEWYFHGHGPHFIKRAIEIGCDLTSVFDNYPVTKKIYPKLKREHEEFVVEYKLAMARIERRAERALEILRHV